LYRFFDAQNVLLYVGISINPPQRWNQHRVEKPWWMEVAQVTVEYPEDAVMAERLAIISENPRYNGPAARRPVQTARPRTFHGDGIYAPRVRDRRTEMNFQMQRRRNPELPVVLHD